MARPSRRPADRRASPSRYCRSRGTSTNVVFLFDSLEQIRGSLSEEQEVTRSVETLFANYLKLLQIPYLHVVYTVPPYVIRPEDLHYIYDVIGKAL